MTTRASFLTKPQEERELRAMTWHEDERHIIEKKIMAHPLKHSINDILVMVSGKPKIEDNNVFALMIAYKVLEYQDAEKVDLNEIGKVVENLLKTRFVPEKETS